MTATEKRIRIAELRGWTRPTGDTCYGSRWLESVARELPDYLNSRDACAEFEAGLTPEERIKYVCELHWVVPDADLSLSFDMMHDNAPYIFPAITATPAQRCDAFLRVKGENP